MRRLLRALSGPWGLVVLLLGAVAYAERTIRQAELVLADTRRRQAELHERITVIGGTSHGYVSPEVLRRLS